MDRTRTALAGRAQAMDQVQDASRLVRTVDGGTMAVGQAVGAFELFTGRAADPARMERHFQRLLAGGAPG